MIRDRADGRPAARVADARDEMAESTDRAKAGDLFGGARIVAASALAMAAAAVVAFATHAETEEALRQIVRASARVGVVLFALAFGARPLRQLWSSPATGWLLRNRRYVGLAFAVAHFTHLAAIAGLAVGVAGFAAQVDPVTLVGGGLAYVLLAGMTLTSTDRTAAWLSRANWRRLHLAGSYALWFIFFTSYGPRALEDARYAPAVLLLGAALAARVAVWVRARMRRAEVGAAAR